MVNYLLDTHTLLWLSENSSNLSNKALKELRNTENVLSVSIISFWELTIKVNIGKLKTKVSIKNLYNQTIKHDIQILQLKYNHINKYETLALHHRDPFDRMIIAQAQIEKMTIMTKDKNFSEYDVSILW